ncbi:TetR/AcrR family transcriptional regulator [Gordonia jinhuaensis]|uniref:TetR family transcriptional regulator n=1 Tax=Gordonia jinhuaensis TaxID=1517702 RepID=A0A916WT47_9ACTN|nr:TetR/AcrR family transcriptional regulator [Gordonia jinhuaensis]GGB32235.1 TetR family transcriptional regulator [Gordonia jinhuaensis]
MSSDSATTGQRGRPRDPDFEDRVFDTVVALYVAHGLDGVTMGAVARGARVGKASLYMRWEDRDSLIRDALAARIVLDTGVDTGDFRADLRRLAEQMLDMLWTDTGLAYMRRIIDSSVHPEVFRRGDGSSPIVLDARRLVRNAIERGELPRGTSPTVLMDMLFGASVMHASITPPGLRSVAQERSADYLDALVDAVIAGATAHAR